MSLVLPFKKGIVIAVRKFDDSEKYSNVAPPRKWGWLILFSSSATLLCCALPIFLVSLGFGSVVASIYGEYFPWLKWFGLNEGLTFGITAFILACAGWFLYRPGRTCPADAEMAEICNRAHRWNKRFFWVAVIVWLIGAFAAFVMPLFV